MLPWDPLWRLRHVGYPVSPRGYRGLPAFASLSMAGSAGLVVAEVELQSREEQIERPPWLGREISTDARYYNSNLSKVPYSAWKEQA